MKANTKPIELDIAREFISRFDKKIMINKIKILLSNKN